MMVEQRMATIVFDAGNAKQVQLICCSEGCGDRTEQCVATWQKDTPSTPTVFDLPPAALPSYFGPLFSMRWLLRFDHQASKDQEITVGTLVKTNPYRQLGLKYNPFVLYPPGVAEELWLYQGFDVATNPGQCLLVEFLGEKGAGKSSHLLRWQQQQPGPYHYVPALGPGRWQRLPVVAGGIVYWDEVDRLPLVLFFDGLLRARLQRCTIVIGTHRSLLALARLLGLATEGIHFQRLSLERLRAWIERRMLAAALPNQQPSLVFSTAELETVVEKANSSWREAGFLLHQLTFTHSQLPKPPT
jgi:hypothetical protein